VIATVLGSSLLPATGQLARVRGRHWVVTDVAGTALPYDVKSANAGEGQTMVTLSSVEDDGLGEELRSCGSSKPAGGSSTRRPSPTCRRVCSTTRRRWARSSTLRWGAVTNAETTVLQSPFRAGIAIVDYQLEPVTRALTMPRVNLLVADDVGLGKTIEAGLVIQELLLRHRARRVMVVCPAPLTVKWREELGDRFGLDFRIVDTAEVRRVRHDRGLHANPFRVYPHTIVSLPWLRGPRCQRLLAEVLGDVGPGRPRMIDLLIVDEAHHCAPPGQVRDRQPADPRGRPTVRAQRAPAVPLGHPAQRLPGVVDGAAGDARPAAVRPWCAAGAGSAGAGADPPAEVRADHRRRQPPLSGPARRANHRRLPRARASRARAAARLHADPAGPARGDGQRGAGQAADLVTLLLKKRLFSSPAAFTRTLGLHRGSVGRIPFNPNRLEQRAGRIDRYGQRHPPQLRHFVGSHWRTAPAESAEADLDFLTRVAVKVATMREDLGSVNPVLAAAVERRMLGRPHPAFRVEAVAPKAAVRQALKVERQLRADADRLRATLADSARALHATPADVQRVVRVGLALGRQSPLQPAVDERTGQPVWQVPPLTGSWADHRRAGRPRLRRPADQLRRLARGQPPGPGAGAPEPPAGGDGHRAAARRCGAPGTWPEPRACSSPTRGCPARCWPATPGWCWSARTASGCTRSCSPPAGGCVVPRSPGSGSPSLPGILDAALGPDATPQETPPAVRDGLAATWPKIAGSLDAAITARARERETSLARSLAKRQGDEAARTTALLDGFERSLRAALAEQDADQQLSFADLDADERSQLAADRAAWAQRLDVLPAERDAEVAAISRRYAAVRVLWFPAAVVHLVPAEHRR